MNLVAISLFITISALLWWAARPLNRNYAADDEAASQGGFTHERTNQ